MRHTAPTRRACDSRGLREEHLKSTAKMTLLIEPLHCTGGYIPPETDNERNKGFINGRRAVRLCGYAPTTKYMLPGSRKWHE